MCDQEEKESITKTVVLIHPTSQGGGGKREMDVTFGFEEEC